MLSQMLTFLLLLLSSTSTLAYPTQTSNTNPSIRDLSNITDTNSLEPRFDFPDGRLPGCPPGRKSNGFIEIYVYSMWYVKLVDSEFPLEGNGDPNFNFRLFQSGNEEKVVFDLYGNNERDKPAKKRCTVTRPHAGELKSCSNYQIRETISQTGNDKAYMMCRNTGPHV